MTTDPALIAASLGRNGRCALLSYDQYGALFVAEPVMAPLLDAGVVVATERRDGAVDFFPERRRSEITPLGREVAAAIRELGE